MLKTQKNFELYHGYKKQTLFDEFLRRIFRTVIADTICNARLSLSTPFLTLSSIQRQAYILDIHVRCTTSEAFYSVKISVAQATQLRRLIVGNAD